MAARERLRTRRADRPGQSHMSQTPTVAPCQSPQEAPQTPPGKQSSRPETFFDASAGQTARAVGSDPPKSRPTRLGRGLQPKSGHPASVPGLHRGGRGSGSGVRRPLLPSVAVPTFSTKRGWRMRPLTMPDTEEESPSRNRGGRPRKLTAQVLRKILRGIGRGMPMTHAVTACGLSYQAFSTIAKLTQRWTSCCGALSVEALTSAWR